MKKNRILIIATIITFAILNLVTFFPIVGVLIMGTVQNAMDLLNVPTFYQYVARGSILLAAVLFDHLKHRRALHMAHLQ